MLPLGSLCSRWVDTLLPLKRVVLYASEHIASASPNKVSRVPHTAAPRVVQRGAVLHGQVFTASTLVRSTREVFTGQSTSWYNRRSITFFTFLTLSMNRLTGLCWLDVWWRLLVGGFKNEDDLGHPLKVERVRRGVVVRLLQDVHLREFFWKIKGLNPGIGWFAEFFFQCCGSGLHCPGSGSWIRLRVP